MMARLSWFDREVERRKHDPEFAKEFDTMKQRLTGVCEGCGGLVKTEHNEEGGGIRVEHHTHCSPDQPYPNTILTVQPPSSIPYEDFVEVAGKVERGRGPGYPAAEVVEFHPVRLRGREVFSCSLCGAVTADQALHVEWHYR